MYSSPPLSTVWKCSNSAGVLALFELVRENAPAQMVNQALLKELRKLPNLLSAARFEATPRANLHAVCNCETLARTAIAVRIKKQILSSWGKLPEPRDY